MIPRVIGTPFSKNKTKKNYFTNGNLDTSVHALFSFVTLNGSILNTQFSFHSNQHPFHL